MRKATKEKAFSRRLVSYQKTLALLHEKLSGHTISSFERPERSNLYVFQRRRDEICKLEVGRAAQHLHFRNYFVKISHVVRTSQRAFLPFSTRFKESPHLDNMQHTIVAHRYRSLDPNGVDTQDHSGRREGIAASSTSWPRYRVVKQCPYTLVRSSFSERRLQLYVSEPHPFPVTRCDL